MNTAGANRRRLARKDIFMATSKSIKSPETKQAIIGLDAISRPIINGGIRTGMVGQVPCGSLIDVISIFKPGIKNPRQYWKDHKAQLLSKDPDASVLEPDPELVANLYQLKLASEDGKKYKTDVAPLWVCVYIAMTLSQPFRKQVAKFTAAEIRYRMGNVARGAEWAADEIHEIMATLSPPDYESPYENLGYRK